MRLCLLRKFAICIAQEIAKTVEEQTTQLGVYLATRLFHLSFLRFGAVRPDPHMDGQPLIQYERVTLVQRFFGHFNLQKKALRNQNDSFMR